MFESYLYFHLDHDRRVDDKHLDRHCSTIDCNIEYRHRDNPNLVVDNNEMVDLELYIIIILIFLVESFLLCLP